jgi:hypothetical protein
MDRSVSYRIIILRRPDGYLAWAPAFPELTAREHSARAAYHVLKQAITKELSDGIAISKPAPADPVVQTRTLRIDLVYLREKEELR